MIGKNVRVIDSTLGLDIPRYRPVIGTINSTNLTVDDKLIELAATTSPSVD